MGSSDIHRLQESIAEPLLIGFDCPEFSSFRFLEEHFPNASPAVHRTFSIARMVGCHTLAIEIINPIGLLAEDNEELCKYGGKCVDLIFRISFWRTIYSPDITAQSLKPDELIGYVIIKRDSGVCQQTNSFIDRWYVFEALYRNECFAGCCIFAIGSYKVKVCSHECIINGVLYCQQNGINKCCAHVALRTLLSRIMPGSDISYKTINQYASFASSSGGFSPGAGLSLEQIRHVLGFSGICFEEYDSKFKSNDYSYQKCIYAGVESGIGSLLFIAYGGAKTTARHVLPVYGHTFSSNTWVPDADSSYFMMGDGVGYMPSDLWTGDFIAHDDNFGCNFCIPRKHIGDNNAYHAIALHKPGEKLNSVQAEKVSLYILSSWAPQLDANNIWNRQIIQLLPHDSDHKISPRFVFRTVTVTAKEYIDEIAREPDGKGNVESQSVISDFSLMRLPERLMVVELSLPQLFPANKHKIGEFVFDATQSVEVDVWKVVNIAFCFGRMPGEYLYFENKPSGRVLMRRKSKLVDHTKLLYT